MTNVLNRRVVVAIGAHTDDVELGAGATLARLKREGWSIVAVACSRAESSLPSHYPPDTLELEFRSSMAVLGASHTRVLGLPVRRLDDHRQELLEELVRLRAEFDPELIISHSSNDTHQDHAVVSAEVVRAFRSRTILGFHSPWNERTTVSNSFVEVKPKDLEVKKAMLRCYRSQIELRRNYFDSDYVEVASKYAGFQSGADLAEAFETITVMRSINGSCW